jgi:hypothetical protein
MPARRMPSSRRRRAQRRSAGGCSTSGGRSCRHHPQLVLGTWRRQRVRTESDCRSRTNARATAVSCPAQSASPKWQHAAAFPARTGAIAFHDVPPQKLTRCSLNPAKTGRRLHKVSMPRNPERDNPYGATATECASKLRRMGQQMAKRPEGDRFARCENRARSRRKEEAEAGIEPAYRALQALA